MNLNYANRFKKIIVGAFLLCLMALVTSLMSLGSVSHANTEESLYEQTEEIFKTNLEETYTKFITDNNNKEIAYLNYSENYYSVTVLEANGETFQVTQEKIGNTWFYETLQCERQEAGAEKVPCSQKTNESNWKKVEKENPKNSIASLMIEPITITSHIIGDSKPLNANISYIVKPGKNQNIYVNNYSTGGVEGELYQEISQQKYVLKLTQKLPFETQNLIILNIYQ